MCSRLCLFPWISTSIWTSCFLYLMEGTDCFIVLVHTIFFLFCHNLVQYVVVKFTICILLFILQYVHSAWHVVIALSLVFLLPRKCNQQQKGSCQGSNESELFDVNDYYSASPVFVVTSDLDNLLTTQSWDWSVNRICFCVT